MIDYSEDHEVIKRYNGPLYIKKCIQQLQGIAAAIIYDNEVDDNEIRLLNEWTSKHLEIIEIFPVSAFFPILDNIYDTGKCTTLQRKKLFQLLSSFAADPQRPCIIENIYNDDCKVVIKEKAFLFTGKLEYGSRKKAINGVLERGGIAKETGTVTLDLDYLVVGDLGCTEWKYSRFGNKIERALTLRSQNKKPLIIREKQFVSAVIN